MPSPVLLLSAEGCGQVSNEKRFDPLSPTTPLAAFGAGSLPGSTGVPLALPNDECGMMNDDVRIRFAHGWVVGGRFYQPQPKVSFRYA